MGTQSAMIAFPGMDVYSKPYLFPETNLSHYNIKGPVRKPTDNDMGIFKQINKAHDDYLKSKK